MKKVTCSLILLSLYVLYSGCATFKARINRNDMVVRVSKKNHNYFETADGKTWVPVMINYIVPFGQEESKALATIETYFKNFSENGGNAMRIWISSPFLEIEDEKAGEYSNIKFSRIDKVLQYAKQYNIRIKFTLHHIRTIASGEVKNSWANSKALHTGQGGPFTNIMEYINTEEGKRYYINRVRALAERYSNNDQIFGWELWNEMDAVHHNDWYPFSKEILDSVQALFPHHMVTQTLGSLHSEDAAKRYEKFFSLANNPYVSLHRYIDPGNDWQQYDNVTFPVDSLIYDAVNFAKAKVSDRPVVVNEIGAVEANHAGPSKLYPVDSEGVLIHDMIFAPFFCGAAGTGGMWHWDTYVQRQNLWYHYQRFQNAIKGVDPAKEQFTNYTFSKNGVNAYALKGKTQTMIWLRNADNNWKTELRDKIKPTSKTGFNIHLQEAGRIKASTASVYDPWKDKWTNVVINNGSITLPEFLRSVVVVIK